MGSYRGQKKIEHYAHMYEPRTVEYLEKTTTLGKRDLIPAILLQHFVSRSSCRCPSDAVPCYTYSNLFRELQLKDEIIFSLSQHRLLLPLFGNGNMCVPFLVSLQLHKS